MSNRQELEAVLDDLPHGYLAAFARNVVRVLYEQPNGTFDIDAQWEVDAIEKVNECIHLNLGVEMVTTKKGKA